VGNSLIERKLTSQEEPCPKELVISLNVCLQNSNKSVRGVFHSVLYKITNVFRFGNWDSLVGITTTFRLDCYSSIPVEARDFSLLHSIQTGSGAHPASYQISTGGSFLGVKRQGREADHSPQFTAEFKSGGAIPHVLMAWPSPPSMFDVYLLK
jgi:hypothetical protein